MAMCADTLHSPVFVIGALNLDVAGLPHAVLAPRDSSPGRVSLRAGGVGYNIARHLAKRSIPVELITALGDDLAGALLKQACVAEGIGLRRAVRLTGASGAYLSLHDADGDMAAAVCDAALLEGLTPERLAPAMPALTAAPLIIMDANLSQDAIEWLTQCVSAPVLLDPVSGAKAERVRHVIGRFAAVKPNLLEAERLSGERGPARAAAWFLNKGVRRVFISLGADGVFYADAEGNGCVPAPKLHAPNCTGAGDAMTAGIAEALLLGADTRACAETGVRRAAEHLQGSVSRYHSIDR